MPLGVARGREGVDPIAGRMASAVRAPIWEMGVGVRRRGELRGHGHGVAMVAAAR